MNPSAPTPFPPPTHPVPAPPTARVLQTGWWFVVPLASAGLATFLMVFYGGYRLRSRWHMIAAAGYLIEVSGYVIGVGAFTENTRPHDVVVGLHVVFWLIGIGHVLVLQRLAYRHAVSTPPAFESAPRNAMALAQVAARNNRRKEARELVLQNPAAAHELKVGRPDVPHRQYDDGGLVDINHVPADWLVHGLEITPEQAAQIVGVRESRGGFLAPDEVIMYCPAIQPARFDLIRDRVIVLPY